MLPELPLGSINIWSGTIASIPHGWSLCDGTNGTPDLRDKFVIGAALTYAVGDEGGTVNHVHTLTTDGHIHVLPAGTDLFQPPGGPNPPGGFLDSQTETATADATDNLPTYYALAYVQFTG